MTPDASHYGSLAPIVKAAGWLISSSAAIGFAWRRRARFEPAEVDIPNGGPRVGGLLAAASLAVLFTEYSNLQSIPVLEKVLAWTAGATLISLLVYGYLIAMLTYEKEVGNAPAPTVRQKVVGGFWLLTQARKLIEERGITVQKYFKGCRYEEDKVWPRNARALAKATFMLAYLGLTVCGTNALSAAAILLMLKY